MAFTDEDIKIYDGEEPVPTGLGAEDSAARYVAHRDNGNLEKTRQLGELLAQTLVGDAGRLAEDPYGQQKLVLLSFLISDELEAALTDAMLRQSAAAAFRRRVEELDPAIHGIITDSAAFTLYILHDRRVGNEECGQVLANLCDRDSDETLIREGNALAEEYRGLFSGIIQSYTFKEL
ncbi:MAG: hypothetical protein HFF14_03685 [Angelakisella sp.]|jgi:hypothetical protein|nr:hypothetical protein [Angelakisella sp.]